MKIVSYEDRVARLKTVKDLDEELRKAKGYAMRLQTKWKNAPTLNEKIKLYDAMNAANQVLRKLRLNVFDLEDMLLEAESKAAA